MNKKFLSAILFGALMVSSTGTFVSCKDYDDDIDAINKELTDIKSQLAALQTEVDGGNWVTELVDVEGGFKVTFSNGKTYTIVNGKDGAQGEPGTPGKDGNGTIVEVKDGYWYLDGKKTEYVAVKKDDLGKVKVPFVNEAGMWVFYDKDGNEVVSEYKALGATYVVEADGVYTLNVPDADGKMQAIKLPTAGATLTDVELLGWAALDKMDKGLSQGSDIRTTLNIEYAFVKKIVQTWDHNKETTWSAQKTVAKGQVLTTLAPNNTYLMARIDAGADAADMSFSLKNSKNAVLPVSLSAATEYKGLLSRGANGMYAIALDNTDAVYTGADKYTGQFTNGLYALVEKSGFISNYNLDVATSEAIVVEGKVATVDGKEIVVDSEDSSKRYYEVNLNKDNVITFDDVNAKFVYDYYVEAVDPTIAKFFGFSADKSNGTFKVTKLSDEVTYATFDINVYKLHIDGKIYKEPIIIKPIRTLGNEVVYDLGNVQIKKSMKLNVSLDKMFTALGSDAEIWKNAALGVNGADATIVKDADKSEGPAITYTYKKADGSELAKVDGTATQFDAVFSALDGTTATLTPGTGYTITINYKHDSNVLNTIKVKFTPVMPALSSYIAKREALWIGNTLMAYFVDPIQDQTDFASKYEMEKGFTTLGSAADADLTEITFSLDREQKINNVKVQDLANIAPDNTITLVTDRDFNQDGNVTEADRWAYGQELNVKVAATYLGGAYKFTDEEIAAAAFKINVQSALKAGKIVPAAGASITLPAAAAGETAKLTADMITGYTYNNQSYSLFKEAAGNYKYSYIDKVEFFTTDAEIYTVTKDATAIKDAEGKVIGYHAEITSKNISQTTNTKIIVKVTDKYGYTKTAELPLTITVGK